MANKLDDLYVSGDARFGGSVALSDNSLINSNWNPVSPLAATNQQHQYAQRHAQAHGTSASGERRTIHIAHGSGNLVAVKVSQSAAAIGDSTATVTVLKNGTSVLSTVVTIDSGDAAFTVQSGTIVGNGSYAAGDVFEVSINVTAGTGTLPQGVSCEAIFRETAA
jgi:hypothetical protein